MSKSCLDFDEPSNLIVENCVKDRPKSVFTVEDKCVVPADKASNK